jgi:hypothetical protein
MEIGFVCSAERYSRSRFAEGAEALDLAAVSGLQLAEPRDRHARERRRPLGYHAPCGSVGVAQRVV